MTTMLFAMILVIILSELLIRTVKRKSSNPDRVMRLIAYACMVYALVRIFLIILLEVLS